MCSQNQNPKPGPIPVIPAKHLSTAQPSEAVFVFRTGSKFAKQWTIHTDHLLLSYHHSSVTGSRHAGFLPVWTIWLGALLRIAFQRNYGEFLDKIGQRSGCS